MKKYTIKLKKISDVKDFSGVVSQLSEDVDLRYRSNVVDGKSLMGIFSLDLSKSLELIIHGNADKVYREKFQPFLVEQ